MSSNQMKDSSINYFNYLTTDLTQTILSHLPLKSLIRCSTVCKQFRSITKNPTFHPTAQTTPWFFLYMKDNIFLRSNIALAYDPLSNEWIKLPIYHFPYSLSQEIFFTGNNGYFCSINYNNFTFSPILKPFLWRKATPFNVLRFHTFDGFMKHGFYLDCGNNSGSGLDLDLELSMLRIFAVGVVRVSGEDKLAVRIYSGDSNLWEMCPSLPVDFESEYPIGSLKSALYKERFYVFRMDSGIVSSFDLSAKVWSDVKTLRPPGVVISCLISCGHVLMLAGLCNDLRGHSFNLWRIDELTMEFSEFDVMPHDLLNWLLDGVPVSGYASLKCVGFGNFIYVFSESHSCYYRACICEIRHLTGECIWRRVPDLPTLRKTLYLYIQVVAFCSTLPIHRILSS